MDIKQKLKKEFRDIKGGLFEKVTKADVGTALDELSKKGATLLCWADPFSPDPCIPEHIKLATIEEIKKGTGAHYTKPIGNDCLKNLLQKKLKNFNNLDVDPARNILITPGSDSGLLFAMMPFIEKGDEVMVLDPSYPNNFLDPVLLGGKSISVCLNESENYQVSRKLLDKYYSDKTKMIIITNPINPTTSVLRKESLDIISEFAIEKDLIVICDQAFEDCVYDDIEFVSIASLPGMFERTITVFSISKGMALSGYRVGYIVAPDTIMDIYFGCAVNIIGATNTAAQAGSIAALQNTDFIKEYISIYDERRKKAYEIINSIPGVHMNMPESSFMAWVNISKLGKSSEIVQYLIDEANVVVNEGTPYGKMGEGYIRIIIGAYKDSNKIYDALYRIKSALTKLANELNITE